MGVELRPLSLSEENEFQQWIELNTSFVPFLACKYDVDPVPIIFDDPPPFAIEDFEKAMRFWAWVDGKEDFTLKGYDPSNTISGIHVHTINEGDNGTCGHINL